MKKLKCEKSKHFFTVRTKSNKIIPATILKHTLIWQAPTFFQLRLKNLEKRYWTITTTRGREVKFFARVYHRLAEEPGLRCRPV